MSARVNTVWPVYVTTASGIGGMTRWISRPTHSSTLKETASRTARPTHKRRLELMTRLPVVIGRCCRRRKGVALTWIRSVLFAQYAACEVGEASRLQQL